MNEQEIVKAAERVILKHQEFAIESRVIRGVQYNVFKNAPCCLNDLLKQSVSMFGERDLLVRGEERLSYHAFQGRVTALAAAITSCLGVRQGDRVAIAMRNRNEYPIAAMAIAAIGAVVVHLNAWWTSEELDYALTDCGANVIFADPERAARLASCRRFPGLDIILTDAENDNDLTVGFLISVGDKLQCPKEATDPDQDVSIIYTSGSTGLPKGVVLTHRNIISAIWSWKMIGPTREELKASAPNEQGTLEPPQPANLVTVPFFHVSGMNTCFLMTLAIGGKAVILDKWDAERAADLIAQEKITRFWGVPTMTADLLSLNEKGKQRLATLTSLDAGGAKRPPEQVRRITSRHPGIEPSTGYGMTETSGLGLRAAGSEYVEQPDAAGYLLPPVQEMKVVDEHGAPLPIGEIGELVLKSPAIMRGYLNQPEATAEALNDGWLRTGDLVRIDESGMVFIVGRKKDIIIRGGENISSLEVEAAVHEHPFVLEACAFSVPDERLGEIVGVAIHCLVGQQLDLGSLRDFLGARIAQFKLPERLWHFDSPLDRGATEKINKRAVRSVCLDQIGFDSDVEQT